ncbi:MAG TPA: hypothetical protein VNW52_03385, partial [Burkholderiaceae bacterium]|nr:hypothetical protein [Burkholderiaceae bacterium]
GPNFKDYECRIYDSNGKLIRIDHTTDTKYSYTYTNNFADNNGVPLRVFSLAVYQRGTAGQLSQVPATLTVSNPAPDTPQGMYVTAGPSSVLIGATQPTIADYAGAVIWASTVEGFTPGPANQIYKGPANSFTYVGLTPYVPIYVRMAFYDNFGSIVSQLNISSEESATPTASGILVVSVLPAKGDFIGECVYLSTDQNVYRWNGTAWTTAVTASQITGLIAAGQISALGASQITGQLTAAQIASITAAQLTGQITTSQISPNSISTPLLQAGAVSTANLAAGSVVAATIAAGAVTATQIAAGSIQSANIAAGAIDALTIGAGAVTTAALQAGSVNTAVLQAGAITATTIAAGAVQSVSLATGAVTASTIAVGAVTAQALSTGTLITNTAQLGAATVNTLTLGGNAVTIPVGATAYGTPPSCVVALAQAGSIQVIGFINFGNNTGSGQSVGLSITLNGGSTAGSVGTSVSSGISGNASTSAIFPNLPAGNYTVSLAVSMGGTTLNATSIIAIGIMR